MIMITPPMRWITKDRSLGSALPLNRHQLDNSQDVVGLMTEMNPTIKKAKTKSHMGHPSLQHHTLSHPPLHGADLLSDQSKSGLNLSVLYPDDT